MSSLIMLIGAHDNDDNGHGEGGSLKHMLLAGCEIYKLLFTEGGGSAKAVRLQSLGGHALFLDRGGCKSLPVGRYSRYSLFKEDHIYFIPILQKDTSSHDYGVYSLKDEIIKQFPNIPSCIPTPQVSYWYFPTKTDAFVDKEENSPQPLYW